MSKKEIYEKLTTEEKLNLLTEDQNKRAYELDKILGVKGILSSLLVQDYLLSLGLSFEQCEALLKYLLLSIETKRTSEEKLGLNIELPKI